MLIPYYTDRSCDFCKDKDARYRFGEYGLLICEECLGSIQGK